MSYSPRPATLDDLDAILEIEKDVSQSGWKKEQFQSELSKHYSHFLVLSDDETDTQIIAFVVAHFGVVQSEQCEILNLAVRREFQKQGHGKRILRAAMNLALKANVQKFLLDVRKSNTVAIQMYQQIGFTICQIRRQFYANGEDAYTMQVDVRDPEEWQKMLLH